MSLWGAAVNSVTATDTSILVSGTLANPTLSVGVSAARFNPTGLKSSAYTASPGEFVLVDTTSGAVAIQLPTAPADKTQIAAKLVIQGGTNAATVNTGGSDRINKSGGATTLTLSTLSQGAWLQYQQSTSLWYVVADDLPLAQLDARYATSSFATSRAVALAMVLGS